MAIGNDLRAMEPGLLGEALVVKTEESRGKEALDGVQERGMDDGPNASIVVADDLEEVDLANEVEDVLQVPRLVGNVIDALLVAKGVCIVLVSTRSFYFADERQSQCLDEAYQ